VVTSITRLLDSREPLINARVATYIPAMRVLCVGRHPYLAEHLCRFFEQLGLDTTPSVGLSDATDRVRDEELDAVICDYDLLATMPLERWERDPALSDVPLIAVSLTRHPGEAHLLDVNGIAGFLYLPTLEPEHAMRLLAAVRSRRKGINPPPVLPWPGTISAAQTS
jgi:CheY-like chemotaxis protein